jgi:hypothetical protein
MAGMKSFRKAHAKMRETLRRPGWDIVQWLGESKDGMVLVGRAEEQLLPN